MHFFVLLLLLVFPALFLFIAKLATAIVAGRGTWQLIRNRVGRREKEWKVQGQHASKCKLLQGVYDVSIWLLAKQLDKRRS